MSQCDMIGRPFYFLSFWIFDQLKKLCAHQSVRLIKPIHKKMGLLVYEIIWWLGFETFLSCMSHPDDWLLKFFEIFLFLLKMAVTRSFFKKFWSIFFANIPNFILEKDSQIKIGGWRSGCDFFFMFLQFFCGAKMGVPPQNSQLFFASVFWNYRPLK